MFGVYCGVRDSTSGCSNNYMTLRIRSGGLKSFLMARQLSPLIQHLYQFSQPPFIEKNLKVVEVLFYYHPANNNQLKVKLPLGFFRGNNLLILEQNK